MTSDQWITAGLPLAAVILGIIRNETQMASLERHIFSRIDSLEKVMYAEFRAMREALLRVEGILEVRVSHLEEEERKR